MSIRQALNSRRIKHAGRLRYLRIGGRKKDRDNPLGLGCYLVMTGRGCDDIFRILDSRKLYFWGYVPDAVSEDTTWIISISQDWILPLMIRTKKPFLADKRRNAKKRNLSRQ